MAKYLHVTLLILGWFSQQFDFQTVTPPPVQCTLEEATTIIKDQSVLIEDKVQTSISKIQQFLADANNAPPEPNDPVQVQSLLDQIRTSLDTLNPDVCTKTLQAQLHYKSLKIKALETKCVLNTNININDNALQLKADTTLQKIQSIKLKALLALQKCATKNSFGDCSSLQMCCQQVVLQSVSKIDSKVREFEGTASKGTGQNYCYRKVNREVVELQDDLREDLLECRLGGGFLPESTLGVQSGQSVESTEEKAAIDQNSTVVSEVVSNSGIQDETQPSKPEINTAAL